MLQESNYLKVANTIYSATDYNLFKLTNVQRNIEKSTMRNIQDSMKIKTLDIPIIVNEKMQIIDGHNTFAVRQQLGLPVLYYVLEGAGDLEVRLLNLSRTNWKMTDLIRSFVNSDNTTIKTLMVELNNSKLMPGVIPIALYKEPTVSTHLKTILKDLSNNNVQLFNNLETVKKTIELYNKYKLYTKNKIFYLTLIRNPKLESKNLIDIMKVVLYSNMIKKAKKLEEMKILLSDFAKM